MLLFALQSNIRCSVGGLGITLSLSLRGGYLNYHSYVRRNCDDVTLLAMTVLRHLFEQRLNEHHWLECH